MAVGIVVAAHAAHREGYGEIGFLGALGVCSYVFWPLALRWAKSENRWLVSVLSDQRCLISQSTGYHPAEGMPFRRPM